MRGQLGMGHFDNVKSPIMIVNISKNGQRNVNSGSGTFIKKKTDVSFDDNMQNNSETVLGPSERIVDIACGGMHTICLTNRNRIFGTGFGDTYALGLEKPQTICSFKEITWFTQILSYTEPIEKIACGVSHSGCIIGGKVYLWGVLGINQQLHWKKPTMALIHNNNSSNEANSN